MFRKSLIALFLSSALLAHASPVAEKATENKTVEIQKKSKPNKQLEAEKARLQRQEQALERAKARLAEKEKAIAEAKAKLAEQEKTLEPTPSTTAAKTANSKPTRPSKQDFVAKTKSANAKKADNKDAKSETKTETKSEVKSDKKPETKTETKSEAKSDKKSETKTKQDHSISVYRLNFASPSQNIVCGGDVLKTYGGARGVSCYIKQMDSQPLQAKPKSCQHRWGQVFELAYIGRPALGCYNDTPYSLEPKILAYGKTMRGNGWACTSLPHGIKCVNSDRHGFEIGRKKQKFF
ncbi:DUF6636 domain-containing protein [Alysiella crassa]|uniref:Membrane protein involved in colicin uptake n=1 Tax=Alysiella crassa TaxID=153491 RepID=A0A376BMN2_9NEIS|nr:DUF6636 domain-containing protein [Alysiella crassa]UOP06942.1 hypothetical protein LVJ80_00075 [Alysiella crassa]SSY70921.1 Uncharacterised protein [Alysiella crassa]